MPTRQPEPSNWILQILERHGISAFLLIVGGYYVLHTVVEPMVATAKQFVSDIRECNVIIQNEIMQNNKEVLERYKQIHEMMLIKRELIQKALTAIDGLEDSNREMSKELQVMRAFLTTPAVKPTREANGNPSNN